MGAVFSSPSIGGPPTKPPKNSMDVDESRIGGRRASLMAGHDGGEKESSSADDFVVIREFSNFNCAHVFDVSIWFIFLSFSS